MKMRAGPLLLFITCAVQPMLLFFCLTPAQLSPGPLMLMLTLDRSDQRRLKTDVWTLFCLLK